MVDTVSKKGDFFFFNDTCKIKGIVCKNLGNVCDLIFGKTD